MSNPYQTPNGQQPGRRNAPPQDRSKFLDVHETLKQEMRKQSGESTLYKQEGISYEDSGSAQQTMDTPGQKVSTSPLSRVVKEGIIDTYLYCDSDVKNSSSNITNGILSFSILDLNAGKAIENVIEMEVGAFYIPEIPTGPKYPQYFFYKRVNILVQEMYAQSVMAQSNIRYHFEMDVQPSGIANLLTPASGMGKFVLGQPYKNISTLTFQFRAPVKNVAFEQDIFQFNAVPGTAPARITTTVPHGLTIASIVSVFCSNFSSGTYVDALVNSVNGLIVTVIDAVTLEFYPLVDVGFDFATVLTAVRGQLTVGFRRIAFTIRLRSIVDENTNRIIPV